MDHKKAASSTPVEPQSEGSTERLPSLEGFIQDTRIQAANNATPPLRASSLPVPSQAPAPAPSQGHHKPSRSMRTLAITGLALVAILLLLFVAYRAIQANRQQAQFLQLGANQYDVTSDPLADITIGQQPKLLEVVDGGSQFTINGQFNLNGKAVIAAVERPLNPVAGELWYQKDNNNLYFYNGTEYIDITNATDVNNQLAALTNTLNNVVSSIQEQTGQISLQGTTNQVTVTTNGGTITLSLPQDIAPTSNPQFASLSLSGIGTQNGSAICDASNNCGYANGATSITQGGNSFGSDVVVGATDAFGLQLITDNTARLTVTSSGGITLGGSNTDRLTVTAQVTGDTPFVFQGATDDGFTTSLVVANPTANQTIILPNESGTICLNSGNCAGSGGYGNVLQGGNSFATTMSLGTNDDESFTLKTNNTDRLTISNTGDIALIGPTATIGVDSTARLSVNAQLLGGTPLLFQGATDDGFSTALVISDPTANRTIILPNQDGTVCLSSGNCPTGGNGDVLQGGNNFGANMSVGTNDNYSLALKTNNVDRLTISNTGNATLTGSLGVAGDAVFGTNTTNRLTFNGQLVGGTPLIFQGATDDTYATSLVIADPTANRTIILPNADGTICLSSGNCAGSGGYGDVLQGGNNFGATMVLGTNDNYALELKANNLTALTVGTNGRVGIGTSAPNADLEIRNSYGGSLRVGYHPNYYLGIVVGTIATFNQVGLGTNDGYRFQVSGVDRLTIARESYAVAVNGSATAAAGSNLTVFGVGANRVGLAIQGAAGQTANLQDWRDSAGTALLAVDFEGKLKFGINVWAYADPADPLHALLIHSGIGGGSATDATFIAIEGPGTGANRGSGIEIADYHELRVPGGSVGNRWLEWRGLSTANHKDLVNRFKFKPDDVTVFDVGKQPVFTAYDATQRPLTIMGAASQVANLTEWQNSTGVTLSHVTAGGSIYQNGNQVCDTSGNCSGSGGYGNVLQGGNSFGSAMTLGTNDNYALELKANNLTALTVLPSGFMGVGAGATTPTSRLTVFQSSQNASQGIAIAEGGAERIKLYSSTGNSSYLDFNDSDAFIRNTKSSGNITINPNVQMIINAGPSIGHAQFQVNTSGGTGLYQYGSNNGRRVSISNNNPQDLLGRLNVSTDAAGVKGIVIRGAASQTAYLQEWQNDTGAVLTYIDAAGNLRNNGNSSNGPVISFINRLSNQIGELRIGYGGGGNPTLSGSSAIEFGTSTTYNGASNIYATSAGRTSDLTVGHSRPGNYGVRITSQNTAGDQELVRLRVGGGDAATATAYFNNIIGLGIGTTAPAYLLDVAGTANAITLYQNGNQVCDTSGNCSGSGGYGNVLQGGNSFGSAMTLGTNDNYALNLETNGTTYFTLSTAGVLRGSNGATLSVPGSGTGTEQFGAGATTSGSYSTAVGATANAGGSFAVALGYNAVASSSSAIAIGYNASAAGSSVGIGSGVSVGQQAVAIGTGSFSNSYGTALGYQASASGHALALGHLATAGDYSIAVGREAATTGARQIVVGSNSYYISEGYFGAGVTAGTPRDFRLNATGGSGTDIAGANLLFAGGRGTGTSAGGDIIFQTAGVGGASGAGLNTLSERMRITSTGKLGIGTSTPSSPLTIYQSGGGENDGFFLDAYRSSGGAEPFRIYWDNSTNRIRLRTNHYLALGTSGGDHIFMNYAGNDYYTTISGGLLINPRSSADVTLSVRGASGQVANLQEWLNGAGTALASISATGDLTVVNATITGTLTVTSAATFNNTLTVNGHIITGNTSGSTAAAAAAAAGTGASASVSGNDTSGTITITTGTGVTAGELATITFASAYGTAPNVVITPKDVPGATYPQAHYGSTTSDFVLKSFNALEDGTTYTFTYFIAQ